jgi:hypothetical protein
MMQEILVQGQRIGDPAGCVVCHGGNPQATVKEEAHKGKAFYPDPGSPWINKFTCGQCHAELVKAQWNSLMMTEAGKIQGAAWAFGSLEGYEHRWANYDAANPDKSQERLGTNDYSDYMKRLKDSEPQVFPEKMTSLPEAPTDLSQLAEHPEQAVFTYLRTSIRSRPCSLTCAVTVSDVTWVFRAETSEETIGEWAARPVISLTATKACMKDRTRVFPKASPVTCWCIPFRQAGKRKSAFTERRTVEFRLKAATPVTIGASE